MIELKLATVDLYRQFYAAVEEIGDGLDGCFFGVPERTKG
jgi:hypothetical protein